MTKIISYRQGVSYYEGLPTRVAKDEFRYFGELTGVKPSHDWKNDTSPDITLLNWGLSLNLGPDQNAAASVQYHPFKARFFLFAHEHNIPAYIKGEPVDSVGCFDIYGKEDKKVDRVTPLSGVYGFTTYRGEEGRAYVCVDNYLFDVSDVDKTAVVNVIRQILHEKNDVVYEHDLPERYLTDNQGFLALPTDRIRFLLAGRWRSWYHGAFTENLMFMAKTCVAIEYQFTNEQRERLQEYALLKLCEGMTPRMLYRINDRMMVLDPSSAMQSGMDYENGCSGDVEVYLRNVLAFPADSAQRIAHAISLNKPHYFAGDRAGSNFLAEVPSMDAVFNPKFFFEETQPIIRLLSPLF